MKEKEKKINDIIENSKTFLDEEVVEESMMRTWDRVESGMAASPKSLRRNVKRFLYYAAAACLVFAAVLGFYMTQKSNSDQAFVVIANNSDNMKHVMLPDGSGVWLYYGSVLTYPEQFQEALREVSISGEAFFDVVRNERSGFRVNSDKIGVTVLGTRFNIRTGYDGENAEVVLESGSVEIDAQGISPAVLVPGQMAVVVPGADSFEIEEVDVQFYTSWKDDYLNINSQTIRNVCALLGKRYRAEITTGDVRLAGEVFSGRFYKNQSLEEILDIIALTTNSRWSISDGIYRLMPE